MKINNVSFFYEKIKKRHYLLDAEIDFYPDCDFKVFLTIYFKIFSNYASDVLMDITKNC